MLRTTNKCLLDRRQTEDGFMVWPNTLIIAGTLLIAIGGIAATYGWNARTEVAQKKGLIRSVAAELLVNLKIV